jgi:hypothetical protein
LVLENAVKKLCRVVKVCAVTRSVAIKPKPTVRTSRRNGFLMHVFIRNRV